MKPLLLLLVSLSALAEDKRCLVGLSDSPYDSRIKVGLYDNKPICRKGQQECVESPTMECKPVFVNLGEWNPVFNQYERTVTITSYRAN